MVKQAQTSDYQDLASEIFKEKSGFLLTGLIVVTVFVLSSGYLINRYTFAKVEPQTTKTLLKPSTVKPTSKFPTTYTVQEGDFLAGISQKMYGSDVYIEDIMKANNFYTAEALETGTKLIIPVVTPKPSTTSQGEIGTGLMTGPTPITVQNSTYVVQPGESLSDIALKIYGDNNAWVKIAQFNNITDPNVVTEGMTLKLPH